MRKRIFALILLAASTTQAQELQDSDPLHKIVGNTKILFRRDITIDPLETILYFQDGKSIPVGNNHDNYKLIDFTKPYCSLRLREPAGHQRIIKDMTAVNVSGVHRQYTSETYLNFDSKNIKRIECSGVRIINDQIQNNPPTIADLNKSFGTYIRILEPKSPEEISRGKEYLPADEPAVHTL